MPYELVVLTDGTAVMFAVPNDPQEPEPPSRSPPETPRVAWEASPQGKRAGGKEPRDRPRQSAGQEWQSPRWVVSARR